MEEKGHKNKGTLVCRQVKQGAGEKEGEGKKNSAEGG